uniref:CLPTM1 regulator of GABA type A receptor forward trafficking n=1 Tax=Calidris pygmaea TaxID=425635 RepID=A0A8C3PH07_9CHAR
MAAPGTEVAAGPAPGPGQVRADWGPGEAADRGGGDPRGRFCSAAAPPSSDGTVRLPPSFLPQVTSNGSAGSGEAAAAETQRQQPAPNAWQVIKGVLFRIFIIWAISSWFRRGPAPQEQSSTGGTPRAPSRNLFPKDTLMDLYVYISEHEHFTDFNVSSALFWQKRDLVYGDWTSGENADGCYEHYGEVDISQSVQQNGSIYIHVYFTKSGFHPDPRQKNLYRRLATVHTSRMINKYKRRRFQKTKNLLTGETEADPEMIKRAEDYGPVEVISHWHPNLTINMVDDHTPWVKGSVPPPLDQYVKFDAISGDYYPILYFNDYWNLQKDYFPINETLQRLPFRLSFCPLSLWRWQLYAAQSTKSPWNFLGEDLYEQSDEEQDSVKVALLETNPYLLALTIIVSIVHSIFEFLAFKNDIQFWNSRQSLEGLSVRSVFFGVFQSLVVLLYILDNETNFVVQVSVFIGLLIDLWKITKVMDVRLDRENKVAGVFPRVTFKDKSTYIESSTKVYDDVSGGVNGGGGGAKTSLRVSSLRRPGLKTPPPGAGRAVKGAPRFSGARAGAPAPSPLMLGVAASPDGFPVPLLDPLPLAGLLRRVQPALPGAQGLVLLGAEHALRLPPHLW